MWTAAFLLMGLRFDEPFLEVLLQGVLQMEESTFYQMILPVARRRVRRMRPVIVIRQGTKRFGGPPRPTRKPL